MADSTRTMPGGVGLQNRDICRYNNAIPQLLLPPAGTGEELFVDGVKLLAALEKTHENVEFKVLSPR